MSVLKDSRRGIVPVTVVYVYTSNAICSLFHEFLSVVRVTRVHCAGDAKPQWTK